MGSHSTGPQTYTTYIVEDQQMMTDVEAALGVDAHSLGSSTSSVASLVSGQVINLATVPSSGTTTSSSMVPGGGGATMGEVPLQASQAPHRVVVVVNSSGTPVGTAVLDGSGRMLAINTDGLAAGGAEGGLPAVVQMAPANNSQQQQQQQILLVHDDGNSSNTTVTVTGDSTALTAGAVLPVSNGLVINGEYTPEAYSSTEGEAPTDPRRGVGPSTEGVDPPDPRRGHVSKARGKRYARPGGAAAAKSRTTGVSGLSHRRRSAPAASVSDPSHAQYSTITNTHSQYTPISAATPQYTPISAANPQYTPITPTNPQYTPISAPNSQYPSLNATNPQFTPISAANPQYPPISATNPQYTPMSATNPQYASQTATNSHCATTAHPHFTPMSLQSREGVRKEPPEGGQKRVKAIPHHGMDELPHHHHLTKSQVEGLFMILGPHYSNPGRRAPLKDFVLASLVLLSSKDSYREMSEQMVFKSRGWMHKTIHLFCNLMVRHLSCLVEWPSGDAAKETVHHFQDIAGVPGVIGAMGTCHMAITKAPVGKSSSFYSNAMQFHSIHLLAVADHRSRFTYVNVGRPGSLHESKVYQGSSLCRIIENESHVIFPPNTHIVAGATFPLHDRILTPYPNASGGGNTVPQAPRMHREFSTRLLHTRRPLHLAFQLLRAKWQRLKCLEMQHVSSMSVAIKTCCILHNICMHNDSYKVTGAGAAEDDPDKYVEVEYVGLHPLTAIQKRDLIAHHVEREAMVS